MQHSRVTSKDRQPFQERFARHWRIKPGDKLEYLVEGDHATIRVHPGTRSLKGALASKKGKGMSFAQIREAAAEAARVGTTSGEQAKAGRHQSDCSLSRTGSRKACQGRRKTLRCLRPRRCRDCRVASCFGRVRVCYWNLSMSIHVDISPRRSAGFISSPGVEIGRGDDSPRRIGTLSKNESPFVDCVLGATAAADDTPVATFDQDFSKVRRRARRNSVIFPSAVGSRSV